MSIIFDKSNETIDLLEMNSRTKVSNESVVNVLPKTQTINTIIDLTTDDLNGTQNRAKPMDLLTTKVSQISDPNESNVSSDVVLDPHLDKLEIELDFDTNQRVSCLMKAIKNDFENSWVLITHEE